MKRLFSMLLVLTMVVTTLMGVMVVDVNAAATIDTSTTPATITLQFGAKVLPGNESNMAAVYGIGKWYAHGYSYTDEDLAKDPKKTTITGTETERVNFLDTSKLENPLVGTMEKWDWKDATFYDYLYKANGNKNDAKTLEGWITDGKTSANYARLRILTVNSKATSTNATDTLDLKKITGETIYSYSFYAYTDPNTTMENPGATTSSSSILLAYTAGGSAHLDPKVYATQVQSAAGIPHKIDVVFSSNGTTNYANVYVDGVQLANGVSKANDSSKQIKFLPRFSDMGFQNGTSVKTKDTDWYITSLTAVPGGNITPVTQDEVKADLIVVPNFNATAQAKTFRTDDYITGVNADLDADIKAVLETTNLGDKVVEITESKYNDVTKLIDKTVAEPTVELVSRTTGEVVAYADATGSMDNYYFRVKGIFIAPKKVADPVPYVNITNKVPFTISAADHDKINVRMLRENYRTTVLPADEPAFGGLRTGFVRITNEPRGSFYFSNGTVYYNQAGYYAMTTPGMVKRSTYAANEFENNMTTLQFDIYAPEYTFKSGEAFQLSLSGYQNDASTNNKNTRAGIGSIYFTTNGKASTTIPATSVDLVGNAWNTVTVQIDATNTPTTGTLEIRVYVNGEKQLTMQSSAKVFAETSKNYMAFLEYARFYTPSYVSGGFMNDAWYVGDFTPTVTSKTTNAIDASKVSGVTISVDNENNLIAYDNAGDADYAKLVAAMEAAGYNAVYEKVVDKALIEAKYVEVDGAPTYSKDKTTNTGVLVKRWIESPNTDAWIVNKGDTDGDGKNEYEIKNTNAITSATDHGDGTATIVATSQLQDMNVYPDVAHKADEIINMLIAEGNTDAVTNTLVGFTSVNEEGKLPRIYSLQTAGTELYTLGYDEATGEASLTYREYAGTDKISFIMVVGAYSNSGKMVGMSISEVITIDATTEADGVKTKTFTADFGELDLKTVRKFKVFAFDGFASRIPLVQNYSANNTLYVAPQN